MRKKILIIATICLLYLLLGTTLPFLWHKEVSEDYIEAFDIEAFFTGDSKGERVAYIQDNVEALTYRLQMLEAAKEEVILSTFDFNVDEAGKDMMAALLHAADRGVSVRIIVDGTSGLVDMQGSKWFQALAVHENIEMKIYNPLTLLQPWKLQTRLHDKYLIVDDQMYLLGGRNVVDFFLGDYSLEKNYDGDVFVYREEAVRGTSLDQLKEYFLKVWSLDASKNYICRRESRGIEAAGQELRARIDTMRSLYPEAYQTPDWIGGTMEAGNILLLSNPVEPVNKEPELWFELQQFMQTGDNILIYTPYIICNSQMYEDLTRLCDVVGSVSIITNHVANGANIWGCTDYMNQKQNILETGITVYEYMAEHSLHTKTVLIDDRISIIGSFNFDMRSAYLDTELMLVIDSPELNSLLQEYAREEMRYCRSVSEGRDYEYGEYYEEREISRLKKAVYEVVRFLTRPIRHLF